MPSNPTSPSSNPRRSIPLLPVLVLAAAGTGVFAEETTSGQTTALSFADFFEAGSLRLVPSATLLGLSGRRVRLVGFMARIESPRPGSFYLCPRPTFVDEEGAGTADLPPEAVAVTVPGAEARVLAYAPGRIEVAGVLDVGYHEGGDGAVSWIRLTADVPSDRKEK